MTAFRSFSQWSDMNTCPYMYELKRVEHVDQIPAAWTAQGTAVHETLEAWEKSSRQLDPNSLYVIYLEAYQREIQKLKDREDRLYLWFSSGPYDAEADIPRREQLGWDGILKTMDWYAAHPAEVPWVHPDGRIGVELRFSIDLGGVEVIGFVDWYGRLSEGCKLGPRDYKSGRNPGKHMQLKLADLAMDDHFSWRKEDRQGGGQGDFFMTRTGKPTVPYDLNQIDRDDITVEFQAIDEDIRTGHFPPNPSPENCKMCPVRRACKYRAV